MKRLRLSAISFCGYAQGRINTEDSAPLPRFNSLPSRGPGVAFLQQIILVYAIVLRFATRGPRKQPPQQIDKTVPPMMAARSSSQFANKGARAMSGFQGSHRQMVAGSRIIEVEWLETFDPEITEAGFRYE